VSSSSSAASSDTSVVERDEGVRTPWEQSWLHKAVRTDLSSITPVTSEIGLAQRHRQQVPSLSGHRACDAISAGPKKTTHRGPVASKVTGRGYSGIVSESEGGLRHG
jgi:hypothetical protein